MGNALFGWPIYSDPNTINAPTLAGGSWLATADIALANLQDRRMAKVARSTDARLQSTRFSIDLKAARRVGVIAIPAHTLSRTAKVRVLAQNAQAGSLLFGYEAGDDVAALGGTFTRVSVATYTDRSGVRRVAAAGEIRDGHFINGIRHVRLEPARTNLVLQSSTMSVANGWSTTNSCVISPGQSDAMGGAGAIAASGYGNVYRAITGIVTDGTKGVSFDIKHGTAAAAAAQLYDTVTGVGRAAIRITWNAGVPVITAVANAIIYASEAQADGWYRIRLAATGVVSANGQDLFLTPDPDNTGGLTYFGKPQVEDAPTPTSYIPTDAATAPRAADGLTFPITFGPNQVLSIYESHVDQGSAVLGGGIVLVGAWAANNSLGVYNSGRVTLSVFSSSGSPTAGTGPNDITLGDLVETVAGIDGANQYLTVARNGGVDAISTLADSGPFTTWSANTLKLNDVYGTIGSADFRSVRVKVGTQSTAAMRASVYDSGWLDVWPVVFPPGSLPADDPRMVDGKYSAEDAVGFNIGFVHVPPAAVTLQYGSIQISDEANPAGYVDLGRLMVCGAYQPSLNMIYGAKVGLTTESTRVVTDGGAASYNEKPTARYQAFSLESIPEDELLVNLFDMMRRVGITKQFFYVHDPADTYHMHRRSFACVMRELSALEYPSYKRGTQPIAVIEDL